MCRLLGILANKPVDFEFSLVTGLEPFQKLGEMNPDGWGIGYYVDDNPKSHKEPFSANRSKIFGSLAAQTYSKIFICHVRKATYGNKTLANCHPFLHNRWMFAHNGSIDREGLWYLLNNRHRELIQGDTDSEVYFHWIMQNVEASPSVAEGIRMALGAVCSRNHSGLNFLLSDGKNLFAYRDASQNSQYYSLYYLDRNPTRKGLLQYHSKEINALIKSKALRGERAILVCSEKLTEEKLWKEIPLGCLLIVDSELSIQLKSLD